MHACFDFLEQKMGGGAPPGPSPWEAKAEIIKVVALQYEIIYNDQ